VLENLSINPQIIDNARGQFTQRHELDPANSFATSSTRGRLP